MDTAQWSQGNGMELVNAMAEFSPVSATIIPTSTAAAAGARPVQTATAERKPRPPHKEQALHCPRCNSGNTKFCYYNNYSLTQPRHFCKTCRRYWTEGGSLRNVPVGGGSRKKNKPSSLSSSHAAPSTTVVNKSTSTPHVFDLIPPFRGEEVDLKLAFHGIPEYNSAAREFVAYAQIPSTSMTSEFPTGFELMQELRPPTLNLPFNLVGPSSTSSSGSGNLARVDDQARIGNGEKLLFPFENMKPAAAAPSNNIAGGQFDHQNKQQFVGDHPGFWNGINIGGGPW